MLPKVAVAFCVASLPRVRSQEQGDLSVGCHSEKKTTEDASYQAGCSQCRREFNELQMEVERLEKELSSTRVELLAAQANLQRCKDGDGCNQDADGDFDSTEVDNDPSALADGHETRKLSASRDRYSSNLFIREEKSADPDSDQNVLLLESRLQPGIVTGSIFGCPDLTSIDNTGREQCGEARMCHEFDCAGPLRMPGYHPKQEFDEENPVPCGKYGCLLTCCRLMCPDLEEEDCTEQPKCSWDAISGICRHKVGGCLPKESDKNKLVLLTSKGFGQDKASDDRNTLEPDVVNSFAHLVSRLKGKKDTHPTSELFADLKVLVIGDSCYPQLVTDKAWHGCEDFRYQMTTMPDNEGEPMGVPQDNVYEIGLFDAGFDPGWGPLNIPAKFSRGLGKKKYRTKEGVMFDFQTAILAREAVVEWNTLLKHSGGVPEEEALREAVQHIRANRYKPPANIRASWGLRDGINFSAPELVQHADVIAFNGGNPDFLFWAVSSHPAFVRELTRRISAGNLIYLGRSAGAMLAGEFADLSVEEGSRGLMKCSKNGFLLHAALSLVGHCSVRPHYNQDTWDTAVTMIERTRHTTVLRIPNGEAVQCMGGVCRRFGTTRAKPLSRYLTYNPNFDTRQCTRRGEIDEYVTAVDVEREKTLLIVGIVVLAFFTTVAVAVAVRQKIQIQEMLGGLREKLVTGQAASSSAQQDPEIELSSELPRHGSPVPAVYR